jgi:hypothetical protein
MIFGMLMTHLQVPQAFMNTMVAIWPIKGHPKKTWKALTNLVKENLYPVKKIQTKQKDVDITVNDYPVVSDSPHTSSCIVNLLAQAVVHRCKT